MLLQITWNGGEFFHNVFGTYDMATILTGGLFNFLGLFLSGMGKIMYTGENKTPDPAPNPLPFVFVFTNRFSRLAGSLPLIFVIMRIFAYQFTNMTLLILFAFMIGFLNYLLTDWFLNLGLGSLSKYLPKFSAKSVQQGINDSDKK